jgi:hypothetical protein
MMQDNNSLNAAKSPVLFKRKLKVRKPEDVDSKLRAQYHTTGDHAMRIEQMNLSNEPSLDQLSRVVARANRKNLSSPEWTGCQSVGRETESHSNQVMRVTEGSIRIDTNSSPIDDGSLIPEGNTKRVVPKQSQSPLPDLIEELSRIEEEGKSVCIDLPKCGSE